MSGPTLGTIRGTIEIDYDGNGIVKAERDIDKLGKTGNRSHQALNGLAKGLAIGAAGIAGGFALAAKSAIDFEKQISAIKAVSGATTEEVDKLRKKALQLGADTKFSASEAALAMEELVKAGLSVDEVLNGAADATVALAAAGEVDLPYAAQIASNAMNQFALSAQDLPRVADLIAGAANASAIDVSEFGFSLSQVGAVSHLAGQSFEDTAVAIAALGNAGIKGSDAGTSLKTFLSNLVPTTKTAKDALRGLGIITKENNNLFLDAKGNYKSLSDIAGILNTSLKGLSESQQQVALETIFGSDAIRAASIIAKEGKVGFEELKKEMNSLTAAEVAATRMDNVAGSIEQLKGSAETLAINIGTKLLPTIQSMVDTAQKAVDWFGNLSDEQQKTIIQVIALTGAILGALAVFVKIVQGIQALKVAVGLIKLWTIWGKIAAAATKVWAGVQWLLNAAMAANPIGLIIIAIIALIAGIVLLWKKCAWFREAVMAVWNAIKTAAKAVADWFMSTLWPTLKKVWEGIVAGFQWLGKAAQWVWTFLTNGFKGLMAVFQKVWGFIGPLVKSVFGLIVSVVKTAWTIVSAIFQVWWAITSAIFGKIWEFLVWVWNNIKTAITAVVDFLWPYISKVLTDIKVGWEATWNAISSAAKAVWDFIKGVVVGFFSWITPYVLPVIQFLVDWITKSWNWLKDTTAKVWENVKTNFMNVWNWIKDFVQTSINRIIAVVDTVKSIVEKIRKFFGQLKEAASGGVGSLWEFVKTIPGKIIEALGNVGKMLYESGKKIIQGLIDGIGSMISALKGKVSDALSAVRDFLPFSPAKEGPFSGKGWTLYSGMELMNGFAQGIARAASMPTEALSGVLGGVAAPLTPGTSAGATSTTNNTTNSSVVIEKVEVKTILDPSDPASSRKAVGELHKALDDYERSRK